MIKAFIFDLDGTLIDTEKIYRQIWPKAIADLGHVFTDEMFLSLRSLGRPFAPLRFKEWFGDSFDYDEARRIRKGYFDAYIEKNGIELKSGTRELLDYLHKKGIITAIATATDIERATEYLKLVGLEGEFDRVVSATMVDEGKPSPKVYEYACSELGLTPAECVAVEDAPNGVRSAAGAGLSVIMVPDLTQPDEELLGLITCKADCLTDIIGFIENGIIKTEE
ncbi:MAG: HAD family phosphatase [Lachnospiraceae bacterium]|nr:HAD family phosphatase [Lachnospiraceae bacterium]